MRIKWAKGSDTVLKARSKASGFFLNFPLLPLLRSIDQRMFTFFFHFLSTVHLSFMMKTKEKEEVSVSEQSFPTQAPGVDCPASYRI